MAIIMAKKHRTSNVKCGFYSAKLGFLGSLYRKLLYPLELFEKHV